MLDSREKKNAYMDSLKENLTGVSPQNSAAGGDGGDGGSTPSYYDQLKNESYRALLKGEVQAYAAKEQAKKYTQAGLMANGYGTQGISESAALGIGNTYSRALKESQNEYDQSILAINNQEKEAAGSEFESLATLMSNASTPSQLQSVLDSYGIKVDNGVLSGDYYDSLDDASKRQLNSLYALYNDELVNNDSLNPTFFDEDDLRYATFTRNDGSTKTLGAYYDEEIKDIIRYGDDGTFVVGGVVRVRNGEGETIYIKRTEKGYQLVNRNEFEKAANRFSLTRKDKSNIWSNLTNQSN